MQTNSSESLPHFAKDEKTRQSGYSNLQAEENQRNNSDLNGMVKRDSPIRNDTEGNVHEKKPSHILVETYEQEPNVQEFQATQQNSKEELTHDGDSQDNIKNSREEEFKVTRLTGFSKNTCNSVNSLEYSPSPKKENEKPVTGFRTSPINISNQEDGNLAASDLNLLKNMRHGPSYSGSANISVV